MKFGEQGVSVRPTPVLMNGPHPRHGLRQFQLGQGVNKLQALRDELDDMRDILLGREQPPIDNGIMTLMEVADAFYARAKEMEQVLMRLEADGVVARGSSPYRFRTGELRSFIELAKSAVELGSRRVTFAKMERDEGA